MDNTVNLNTIPAQQKLNRSNQHNAGGPKSNAQPSPEKVEQRSDSVSLSYTKETSMTYSSSLTIQTGEDQDQFNLLRGLVTNLLKEQGLDLKISIGEQEVDLNTITQEEATALVADDGYFGVDQTSDRIVDFAIAFAGKDPSRLDAIREGVQKGFNDALEAFGGTLPDISYDTMDAVMSKLDDWAEVDKAEQAS
jgi:hypothetical protein